MSKDIRDLIGRYATGSLNAEEQKRLFEAALEDQEIFDELAREQDLKQLVDEPGARLRLIRALEPPQRRNGWIFGIAATVAFTIVVVVVLYRPVPKPAGGTEVAKAPVLPSSVLEHATPEAPPLPPKAAPTRDAKKLEPKTPPGAAKQKTHTVGQVDALDKDVAVAQEPRPSPPAPAAVPAPAAQNQVQVQAATPHVQQEAPQQQSAARLIAPQANARAAAGSGGAVHAPSVGFHYSLDNPGHLTIIPSDDGFLSVKTTDGKDIYSLRPTAAGILVDIPLPADATSVNVTFSGASNPVTSAPVPQTSVSGDVQGPGSAAIELKVKQ